MGRHLHRLTALKVGRAKAGLHADGGGLYLQVTKGPGGDLRRSWLFRFKVGPKDRWHGLGPAHTVSLAEAREAALRCRKLRLAGEDPIEQRKAERTAKAQEAAKAITFRQCAEQFLKEHEGKWTNPKHALEWRTSLARFAFPVLGALPVSAVDTPLVLKALKPIWPTIPETASRVRGRIEAVLGWATVHHYRAGDNPARWQQHLEHALPAVVKGDHHAALAYPEAPAFLTRLRQDSSISARLLELIALTAVRLSEAREADWAEIDLVNRVWTISARRMKANKEHRIPLSDAAVAVLDQMARLRQPGSDYVFPGVRAGQPASASPAQRLLKAINNTVTIHGLRSTFRDWAAEATHFPREVAEMALAHAIPDAVEAAYRRGDLFEKRRALMQMWADYCAGALPAGEVVPLRRAL